MWGKSVKVGIVFHVQTLPLKGAVLVRELDKAIHGVSVPISSALKV